MIITVWLLFNSRSCHLWDRDLRRILPVPKVTGTRDVLAGRGQGRRKQKGTDVEMDWIYCSSRAKKKPKGHYGPTTEQNDSRVTDSGGQAGGNGFILGAQVYKRSPRGSHDRGQMNGCKPPGNPKPSLKGTWKGRGADPMGPTTAVCSSSAIDRITTVERRGGILAIFPW